MAECTVGDGPVTGGLGGHFRTGGFSGRCLRLNPPRPTPRSPIMPTLRYFGHAACEVVEGETRLLIDPFLSGNPLANQSPEELNPTAILLSHAHNDHFGDALAIAKRSGATVV